MHGTWDIFGGTCECCDASRITCFDRPLALLEGIQRSANCDLLPSKLCAGSEQGLRKSTEKVSLVLPMPCGKLFAAARDWWGFAHSALDGFGFSVGEKLLKLQQ